MGEFPGKEAKLPGPDPHLPRRRPHIGSAINSFTIAHVSFTIRKEWGAASWTELPIGEISQALIYLQ